MNLKKLGKLTPEGDAGKLDAELRSHARSAPDEMLAVIIKVSEDDYVPDGAQLRARIGPRLLTAEVKGRDLQRVIDDVKVVSVAGAERLPLISPK